jgi:hypothetical protein
VGQSKEDKMPKDMSNVIANMVNADMLEGDINVNVMSTKRFTDKHVKTMNSVISRLGQPRLYGSTALPGVKHVDTVLIDIDQLVDDNENFSQTVRFSTNPKMQSIQDDVIHNGWNLAEIPILVMKYLVDGVVKYKPLEGRTRIKILGGLGVKNVIVDVFDEMDEVTAMKFSLGCNVQKKPYGEASPYDVRKVILELVRRGAIDVKSPNFADEVIREIVSITSKLTEAQQNQIVHDADAIRLGGVSVISFPQGNGAKAWLEKHGYHDSKDRIFVPVGTFQEKVMMSAIRKERELSSNSKIRKICYVVHGGTLGAKDPEGDWIKRCRDFKQNFEQTLKDLSDTFFDGAPIDMKRVEFVGAIPMVQSLNDKYPMNDIYWFDNRKK